MHGCRVYILLLLLIFCFAGIFAAVLWLEGLPVQAVGYALLLSLALSGVGFGAYRVYTLRRRARIRQVLRNLPQQMDGLPPAHGPVEADYQAALVALQAAYGKLATESERVRAEMLDYYTLWAHQIKTPIAAMRLLLQSETHPANRELTAELFRIEQYADMVLQYLRLDGRVSDFAFQTCALDEIVRRAVRKYAPLFIRSRVQLAYDGLPGEVLTDAKWLGFVVEQLLSNALKYTPQGVVTITQDGPQTLVIQDTGIGIAAEDLPRVCEKGFTGYNGRAGHKSTGIGLYLCSRILKQLGHGFSIASEQGKGTRVTIDLSTVSIPRE